MPNNNYHYIKSEPGLWTVGTGTQGTDWIPESDHTSTDEAAARVHYLNGGNDNSLVARIRRQDDTIAQLKAQIAKILEAFPSAGEK
jgi:GH24 family phage-related lysozyme (muramidase)